MPKVSVLIPSYNAAAFLPVSIASAMAQTYQDFEILVIDDGSQDNTGEVVEGLSAQYPGKIRYIAQENAGVSVTRNTGVAQAHGEYLAMLDADDKWLPHRLEEGVKILDADASVGLVHGNVTNMDMDGKELNTPKRNVEFLSGSIFEHLFTRKADICCSTVLMRSRCCREIGDFDVKLTRLGCEDRDLWLRIAGKYKIVYIDKVLTYYRISPQGMSRDLEKMMQARLYVIDKHCPPGDPSRRSLRNKALGKIFRDNGDQYLMQKNFINARREYRKAIEHDPLSFWPWVNWIKAYVF